MREFVWCAVDWTWNLSSQCWEKLRLSETSKWPDSGPQPPGSHHHVGAMEFFFHFQLANCSLASATLFLFFALVFAFYRVERPSFNYKSCFDNFFSLLRKGVSWCARQFHPASHFCIHDSEMRCENFNFVELFRPSPWGHHVICVGIRVSLFDTTLKICRSVQSCIENFYMTANEARMNFFTGIMSSRLILFVLTRSFFAECLVHSHSRRVVSFYRHSSHFSSPIKKRVFESSTSFSSSRRSRSHTSHQYRNMQIARRLEWN